jgi:hypothetical protein
MPNVRFAVGIQRLIPFLGYHHVLMILIAIAIILLCKFASASHTRKNSALTNVNSTAISWLLIILATYPRHLPHQLLL